MAFYSPDPSMGQHLEQLIRALELEARPGLSSRLSITWLRYGQSLLQRAVPMASAPEPPALLDALQVSGTSWAGGRARDPGALLALVVLAAVEAWLQQQLLEDDPELRRTLQLLVAGPGVDALSQLIDLLSGTTSGPSLPPERFASWLGQRQLLHGWLAQLGWPECEQANVCHKLWRDGPFGRERDLLEADAGHGNRLSSDALARLLQALIAGTLLSPPASRRLQTLLEHGSDRPSLPGSLAAGLPEAARIWGLACQGGGKRQDAVYVEVEGTAPFLLVVLSEGGGGAADPEMLPWLAGQLLRFGARG
jgi:hypothetical protein